jgi:hypothetical protein
MDRSLKSLGALTLAFLGLPGVNLDLGGSKISCLVLVHLKTIVIIDIILWFPSMI